MEKGKEWIISHNNVNLAYYSNDLPYLEVRKGFEPPNIPNGKKNWTWYTYTKPKNIKLTPTSMR